MAYCVQGLREDRNTLGSVDFSRGRSTSTMFQLLEPHPSCPSNSVMFWNGLHWDNSTQMLSVYIYIMFHHNSANKLDVNNMSIIVTSSSLKLTPPCNTQWSWWGLCSQVVDIAPKWALSEYSECGWIWTLEYNSHLEEGS